MGIIRWCLFVLVSLGTSVPSGARWRICRCEEDQAVESCCGEAERAPSCCSDSAASNQRHCGDPGAPCSGCRLIGGHQVVIVDVVARPFGLVAFGGPVIGNTGFAPVLPKMRGRDASREARHVPKRPGTRSYSPLRC